MTQTPSSNDDTFDIMQLGRKVDPTPRIIDGFIGGALIVVALRGRTLESALVGAYGLNRIYSALTGESLIESVKAALSNRSLAPKAKAIHGSPRDLVDQASWESFPASDPPAHSPSSL